MTASELQLQGLFDCARLARELGVSRAAAEAIMRQVPKVHVEGLRKVYAKAPDIEAYLAERTQRA